MKLGPELLVKLEKLNVHKCEKCPKVFPNISNLMKHMSYHDEYFLSHLVSAYVSVERARIFKCDKCTKRFDNNRNFMLHKLAHIQENVRNERKIGKFQNDDIEKPYKCPDCDVSYAAQTTLDEHSFLHLPFPHICECGIGYYEKQDLKCHIKLVHGTKIKEEPTLSQNLDPEEDQVIPQTKPQDESQRKSKSKSKKGTTIKGNIKKENPKKKKWKVSLKGKDTNGLKREAEWNIPDPDIDIRKTSDNKYECPECKKLYSCKPHLFIHYRIHSGERPYTCHLCPKAFNQWITLKTHIKRHMATEKIYVCKHCPKAFTLPFYRDRHENIHSAIKAHECPYCHKGFHDPSALLRHKRTHTGDKRYCCSYCPKTFSDVSGLSAHKLRHENKKEFECEICNKRFYNRTDLKNHMVVHTHERSFACDYCKKSFTRKSNLMTHVQRHMILKKHFVCEECNMRFLTKDYLKHHIKTIHKKNTFKRLLEFECNDCSKQFYTKNSLRSHYLSCHSSIRCDECSRFFVSATHFEGHKLIESVQCEICDEKFYCVNMKEKHFKVHLPQKVKETKSGTNSLKEVQETLD